MFTNLIESTSHRHEIKRRGSFLLFTIATYAVLFAIAGVASIHAYDAHLNQQSTDLTIVALAPPEATTQTQPAHGRSGGGSEHAANVLQPVRPVLVDSVNSPTNTPKDVGVTAPTIPTAPKNSEIGKHIADPPGPRGTGGGGDDSANKKIADALEKTGAPPPPPQKPVPAKVIRIATVLNSKAIDLPKPKYPPIAKSVGVQGMVSIQVLIDESGRVVSAKVVSGNPMLIHEALQSAYLARFSPTFIDTVPVKVSGVITYNFVIQR